MEGERVVLGLVVVRRRVVVLFRRVVLAVSSLRVPVDVSSLSRCFCMGRTLLCCKRLQVVVVVFMRGGGRFCVGIRSHYFGVLLVIWAVILLCGWSSLLYGRSWQLGGGGLSLALGVSPLAVVAAVVVWPLSCVVVRSSVGVLVGLVGLGLGCSPIDDERRFRRLSFGRHVAVSNVAPGMCVSKGNGDTTYHAR